jgi:UDP-glucose 4-epimerase
MKKVVVTGGAGFIGSNLSEELAKKEEVIIVDNLSTGRIENIDNLIEKDNVRFVNGSITDLKLLNKTFEDVDFIFHQAAIPSVPRSVENPLGTNEANIKGTLNVLTAARDCGAKKVVYASSSSVYGDTPELPKKEDMKPDPLSPYAVTKLAGEHYCDVFSDIYGINTVCLRYFNVFGPNQDPKSEYAAVIPRFITRVLDRKPPVIFGDGKQTRDFTFIKNVVMANILSMEKGKGVFNVACGGRISINELANKIIEIVGLNIKPIYSEARSGDIRDSIADISLAQRELGYEPKYNLEKGLEVTLKWYSNLRTS